MTGDMFLQRRAALSEDGSMRHTLERVWGDGPRLCLIGHNAAKADAEREDMTVHRWMHFGRQWAFGSLIAVNIYPVVTADPRECRAWLERQEPARLQIILGCNREIVLGAARGSKMTVACWGDLCAHAPDEEAIVELLIRNGIDIYCFGMTASGRPKHVMARGRHRVPDNQEPVLWRGAR